MLGIDTVAAYLLVVAAATLLLAVLIWQTHRTGRTVIVWLSASLLGAIVGSAGSYAVLRATGHVVSKAPRLTSDVVPSVPPDVQARLGKMSGPMGEGPGMMGMGAPPPQRELASLVRKLDLLTGDISVRLTSQQAAAISECLKDVEKSPTISDDEAKQKHAKLLAVFSDAEKERFNAIELPRRGGPGGAAMRGDAMGKGGMGGGFNQAPNRNPFQQEPVAAALQSLRGKLAAHSQKRKSQEGDKSY